jgi:hypothetical protein
MIDTWYATPIKYKERTRKIKKKSVKKVHPIEKAEKSRWNLSIYV